MTVTLQVEPRAEKGKQLAKVRKAGKVPAVVYGPKHATESISVDERAFAKTLKEAGESTIVTLTGLSGDIDVLVYDVAFDPEKGTYTHVDFYAVDKDRVLTTEIPLEFEGEAPAVKLGGVLTKVLHGVEVTCKPSDLPSHFSVDVSSLVDFESQIQVKDLQVGSGVTIENDPEEVIALVQEVVEETDEAPDAVDMSSIEVEKKGKQEAEGESA